MRRRSFVATVEIDGATIVTPIRYAHNSALEAARDILRDQRAGTWSRTAPLTYQNDRDGRVAVITVSEVSIEQAVTEVLAEHPVAATGTHDGAAAFLGCEGCDWGYSDERNVWEGDYAGWSGHIAQLVAERHEPSASGRD